jgi:hypothetical protein
MNIISIKMSKSFFFNSNKLFFKNIENLTLFGIIISSHLAYAITTKNNREIVIKKKYKFDRNGFTEFMIIDDEGKHYNINNSVWYWKWNSIEDWNIMEIDQKIKIHFYGLRIPIFGIFPNVFYTIWHNTDLKKQNHNFSNIRYEQFE